MALLICPAIFSGINNPTEFILVGKIYYELEGQTPSMILVMGNLDFCARSKFMTTNGFMETVDLTNSCSIGDPFSKKQRKLGIAKEFLIFNG